MSTSRGSPDLTQFEGPSNRMCTVLHNAFLGAVYVDLRSYRLLSLDQKECAQKHILSL